MVCLIDSLAFTCCSPVSTAKRHSLDHTVATDVAADTENARCLSAAHGADLGANPRPVYRWQTEFAGRTLQHLCMVSGSRLEISDPDRQGSW
jgi:hypothetical protein